MLHVSALVPCRAFAARALADMLDRPRVMLEGGASVGIALRTLLADPVRSPRLSAVTAYHFTELNPVQFGNRISGVEVQAPQGAPSDAYWRYASEGATPWGDAHRHQKYGSQTGRGLDPALLALGCEARAREAPATFLEVMHFQRLYLDVLPNNPAGSTKLAPGTVDCVLLEQVLDDVADFHATLMALRTLLKPNGALIFTGASRGRPGRFFSFDMMQLALASYTRARLDLPWRRQAGYLSLDEWRISLACVGFAFEVAPQAGDLDACPRGGIFAWPV